MTYDFTTILDRAGHDILAADMIPFPDARVDDGFSVIPMWVADMSFPTAPCILEAVEERLHFPNFGYFSQSEEYYQAIIDWHRTRKDIRDLSKDQLGYENGVLGGLISALNVTVGRGGKVLLHSPTYIGFTHVLTNNGYQMIHSPLKQDENQIWRMDYEDMEEKIVEEGIKAAIICSPYNPIGRVWEREELEKAMEVFRRHEVYVISDEIWSDIILDDNVHIPTLNVNEYAREHTVALYSLSKSFNLAGMAEAYHVICNEQLRRLVERENSLSHYNSMNVLSMHALIGAYSSEGRRWLEELKQVLSDNVHYVCDWFAGNVPEVSFSRPQGTYMLFISCQKWCQKQGCTMDELIKAGWDAGVIWQDGRPFHDPYGIRLNLASPGERIKEAVRRLESYVFIR